MGEHYTPVDRCALSDSVRSTGVGETKRKRQERENAKCLHVWEKGVKVNTSAQLISDLNKSGDNMALQQSKLNLVAAPR